MFIKNLAKAVVVVALASAAVGCGGDETTGPKPLTETAPPVLEGYAQIVYASYTETSAGAEWLDKSLAALVADPTQAKLDAARTAWLSSRKPYGSTEPFRFYGGPIDDEDGPEGRINAWPMDEAYVDYVDGDPTAGLINDPATLATIDEAAIISLNEKGGEKNIAAGYHALEFLLWGQDKNPSGPGARPYTDYVVGAAGTASNQDRRGEYLLATSKLLVSDLSSVLAEWAPDTGAYRKSFVAASPEVALGRILLGMGSLSGAELAGERMQVAYDTKEQEDEHSCFSDSTLADLTADAKGLEDVYLGRHGDLVVPGLTVLVAERDAALDARMKDELAAVVAALEAIPGPFDQAILGDDDTEGRKRVAAAIQSLRKATTTIVEVATLLGIELNVEK